MSASRGSRIGKRAAIALAALLALVALAEVALRIAKPFPLDFPWYPDDHEPDAVFTDSAVLDPDLGWRFAPNAEVDDESPDFHVVYRCNADGFRAVTPREGDDDALRIVFVGDSFTLGTGVEPQATFVELTAAVRPNVRVFNYGMAGYGIDQAWRALVKFGLREKPHIVVALFVADDLSRGLTSFRYRNGWAPKPAYVLDGDELVPRTADNSPGALVRFFERELHLAEVWRRFENKFGLERGFGRRFELNRALFAALHDECARAGAELVVVYLPQRGAWRPAPAFARAFDELGIAYLDLGATGVDDPKRLYFAKDPHINAAGHRFVAERLTSFLLERGWFDRPVR